ncbi:MAG TPA: DNA polymerase III subunit beta [Candidatus Paceibacterota bacterium]
MKIKVLRESLVTAVTVAERITGKKETLPILSCVVISVGSSITVASTNLESGIKTTLVGEIIEKGIVAVSASILSQTIRSIRSEYILLKTEDSNLVIESKGTKTLLKAFPHEEFPNIQAPKKNNIHVETIKFLKSIQSVIYAVSSSMIRPEIGSIYFVAKGKIITTVATDSFRLAEKTTQKAITEGGGEFLIPLKHALELVFVVEKIGAHYLDISCEDSQLTVSGEETTYTSRVVDGTFPNYKEIIPTSLKTEAIILKSDLVDILKKARIFSGADKSIGFHLYPKRKIFSITARFSDVGEMSDTLDAALSGDDLDINFHIDYVADCLQTIDSDSVSLSFAGVGKPLVVRGVSDSSFLYLVMPLNR